MPTRLLYKECPNKAECQGRNPEIVRKCYKANMEHDRGEEGSMADCAAGAAQKLGIRLPISEKARARLEKEAKQIAGKNYCARLYG